MPVQKIGEKLKVKDMPKRYQELSKSIKNPDHPLAKNWPKRFKRIVFELPLAVLFLTRIGIVSPKLLAEKRKYAFVLIFVASVFFTPPRRVYPTYDGHSRSCFV